MGSVGEDMRAKGRGKPRPPDLSADTSGDDLKLEFIVLGILLQQPKTGYDIKKYMDTTGRFMRRNTSMTQVYRSLRQMEEQGWVTHTVEPRAGGKDAKRYRVTEEGETVFLDWLSADYQPTLWAAGDAFFTHIRFRAAFLGRDAVLELLDTEIAFREQQITRYRHRDRTEDVDPTIPFDEHLAGFVVEWQHRRGTERMDHHLDACIRLRRLLASKTPIGDIDTNPLQRAHTATDRTFEEIVAELDE